MDFKFVYFIGFLFIGAESRSLFPDTGSYPSDYGNVEPSKTDGDKKEQSEAPKESPWEKMMKLKDKFQPAADQFSGLKDKLPANWKNPFAKNHEDENFGLGNLYGEEENPTPSNSLLSGLGDKFNQAKDKFKNAEWPKPWHKDLTSESPTNHDEGPYGLDNLFGEGENPEKKSWLDKLNPTDKLNQAKDAWNSWGKKNHDPESPSSDHEPYGLENLFGGAENPEKKSPFSWFDPTNKLNEAKNALENSKWFGKDKESPSNSQDEPYELGNLFGEENENPEKKSFLDKFNPKDKFNQAKDAIKSWGMKDHDPESPSNHDEEPYGLENFFGEDGENPEKKSFLDKLNAKDKFNQAKDALSKLDPKGKFDQAKDALGKLDPKGKFDQAKDALGKLDPKGKFDQAKDALSKLDPKGKFDQAKDALGKLDPKGKFDQAKDALSKLDPKGKFDQTKDAIKNFKFPWWQKQNEAGESPGNADVEYDNDEQPENHGTDYTHGDPYINDLDEDDNQPENPSESDHWPIHGMHPSHSQDPEHSDHETEKKPHHPESLGELLEEELEELEKEAEHQNPADHWPDFTWSDEKGETPEKHHPKKHHEHGDEPHHKNEETPHHKSEETPHHKNEETPHHKNFPDWSWNHHKDKEPHGSPEKEHKEHEKEDTSNSEPMFPDWFGKSDEKHTPKSKDEESEEQYESPEHENSNPSHHEGHHGKDKHSGGTMIPEIPDWLWPAEKEPSHESHHKKHHHPLEETFYDVRGIGDNRKTEKPQGKGDNDEDDTEDEDDDDGSSDDDDDDGNKTDGNNTDDDNEIGREKNPNEDLDPDEADILKDLKDWNEPNSSKSKPKRDKEDEADDDSSDSDDDDDDDDDAENGEIYDNVEKDFSIWKFVLPMVAKNLPSIPNPFSFMNRVTVSFASINDLQRDPEILHKSIVKKVNQKYKETNENTLPGTTISFWPPHIANG